MTEKRIRLIHILYGIALSFLFVALGVCFIMSCLDIYKSADSAPFTPEAINSHFKALIIPSIVCIVTIIGGACINIFLPMEKKKLRARIEDKYIIKNLSKRINYKEAPKELVSVVKSQKSFRIVFLVITILNAVFNLAYMLIYIFTSGIIDAKPDDFRAFFPLAATTLSYAIIPIFVIVVYLVFASFTYAKELEAVRAIVEYNAKKGNTVSKIEEKQCFFKRHKNAFTITIRCVILVVAVSLIVISIFFDDLKEVASLAGDSVCAGCIGLF